MIKMNKFILFLIFGLIIFSPKIIMQAYCLDLIPTTSEKIANVIYKDKKKYKFIYFFTSWCYECNETLDKLHKMQLDRNLSQKYNFYIISLDDDNKKLLKFSNTKIKDKSKIFYFDKFAEIEKFLIKTNINYDNAVPFYCILNENNTIIKEGYFELEQLSKIIKNQNKK
ncbi:hypothetical protein h2es_1297 [Rickettsiales endosymbiont of Trichoplax sp. H2]|nr:hypothetical protein [Rickettsiales endosymbiont of Trichoplax sp. H2]